MCAIVGIFTKTNSSILAEQALGVIEHRGKDGKGFYSESDYTIGHCLHSLVGFVKQPLVDTDKFMANCEIYNWKELNQKYRLSARNDAETLFQLFRQNGISATILEELDGVYAICFIRQNTLYLARDILGVKPIWYSHANGFAFASEKKALEKIGLLDIIELNPRKILAYDIKTDKISFTDRPFFATGPELTEPEDKITESLAILIKNSLLKRIPEKKFGLLFSGGIDSTLLAYLLKQAGKDFTCYTTAVEDKDFKESEDLISAQKTAKELGLNLKIIKIADTDIQASLSQIVPLIEDTNVVKVEVALTFHAACEAAQKDGCRVLFSGLGSEEIFAGYHRHKNTKEINKECLSGLLKLYERDLYRDDVLTMRHNIELRLPFLDKELVKYSLRIPGQYKINGDIEKYILRKTAIKLGLKEELTTRRKKAAQYGSNMSKALAKLTKKAGHKYKSEYLATFYPSHNLRLGALISTGKDSMYAMYRMLRQNYKIECLITIKSKNPDSYMFHTPTIELVKLQSRAMGIPIIIQETEGKKEEELRDLVLAITKAKEKYKLDGIITGALYSNYQRERIEKICDMLGLKIFSPLWHINQETEVREILDSGFKFILTKIAGEGLDKTWLNTEFDTNMLNRLVELNKKTGLNIAGEGGEYETLVLDGPIFKKKIQLKQCEINEESKNIAQLIIIKAELIDKEP